MRRRLVVLIALAPLAALFGACRAPTQATIVVTTTAKCPELQDGIAITVGARSLETEQNLASGFVSATTKSCDPTKSPPSFGTLVITPSDDGDTASVIVVAGFSGKPSSGCKPPKYESCIVARRTFAFIDHTPLTIPITLDPLCVDVPCDAFTTCKKGACYPAETSCDDDGNCAGKGELPDGSVDPDATVVVDGSPPRDGAPLDGPQVDGGQDAPFDAPDVTDGPVTPDAPMPLDAGSVACLGGVVQCGAFVCAGTVCCAGPVMALIPGTPMCVNPTSPSCSSFRFCCTSNDCLAGSDGGAPTCNGATATTAGTCSILP